MQDATVIYIICSYVLYAEITTSENSVLEHVSLDEDLVDHCMTMKESWCCKEDMHHVSKYEEDAIKFYLTSLKPEVEYRFNLDKTKKM